MNGAPNETRTHLCRFARTSLLTITLPETPLVLGVDDRKFINLKKKWFMIIVNYLRYRWSNAQSRSNHFENQIHVSCLCNNFYLHQIFSSKQFFSFFLNWQFISYNYDTFDQKVVIEEVCNLELEMTLINVGLVLLSVHWLVLWHVQVSLTIMVWRQVTVKNCTIKQFLSMLTNCLHSPFFIGKQQLSPFFIFYKCFFTLIILSQSSSFLV